MSVREMVTVGGGLLTGKGARKVEGLESSGVNPVAPPTIAISTTDSSIESRNEKLWGKFEDYIDGVGTDYWTRCK